MVTLQTRNQFLIKLEKVQFDVKIKFQFLLGSTSTCLNLAFSSVTLNVEILLCILVIERSFLKAHIAQNTEISPNFLVWKFCENALFPQSFHKISTQGNLVKFWYSMQ